MRIHCVRCNRKISDKVATCPHCGSYNQSVPEIKQTETTKSEKHGFWRKFSKVREVYLWWLAVSFLLIVGCVIKILLDYMSYLSGMHVLYRTFEEYIAYHVDAVGFCIWGVISFIAAITFVIHDFSISEEEREAMLKQQRMGLEKEKWLENLKCFPHLNNTAYVCGHESVSESTDVVLGLLVIEEDQLKYLSNENELFCISMAQVKSILYDTLERINLTQVVMSGLNPILSTEHNYYLIIDYLGEDGAIHKMIFNPSIKDDVFFIN